MTKWQPTDPDLLFDISRLEPNGEWRSASFEDLRQGDVVKFSMDGQEVSPYDGTPIPEGKNVRSLVTDAPFKNRITGVGWCVMIHTVDGDNQLN